MTVTRATRVIAQAGTCYVLTNDPKFDINNITMNDLGCIVDTKYKTMSPELPILVLTKNEAYLDPVDKPDLRNVNNFKKLL